MDFSAAFPNLKDISLIKYERGSDNVDEYIRKAYKGGYCYYKYKQRKHITKKGMTFDVNSLYPSAMHSKSGNYYPTGKPIFFEKQIPYKCLETRIYPFYVRLRCRFKLKDGFCLLYRLKETIGITLRNGWKRLIFIIAGNIIDILQIKKVKKRKQSQN